MMAGDDGGMRPWLRIDPAFRERILRRDPSHARWLDAVPVLYDVLSIRRSLVPDGAPRYGETSMVVPVRTASGSRAVLKLVSPVGEPEAERRALSALTGNRVVTLLEAFPRERALLLERLNGPRLSETDHPEQSVEIAGAISKEISTAAAPADAPRLADRAAAWLDGIHEQHSHARRSGEAVPEAAFRAAIEAISDLRADTSHTLTHGDLSLENIMRGEEGAWVAIDPLFLCGPVEFEAHTALRSVLGPVLRLQNPGATMRDLMNRFCTAARAEAARARALSHARMVASYYWEAQHGGDPATIENLRRTVDLGP